VDIAGSSFRSLPKIPHCCLQKELEPCLSLYVAVHPQRTAMHVWLGRLLPYQLPKTIDAYLKATLKSFIFFRKKNIFGIYVVTIIPNF